MQSPHPRRQRLHRPPPVQAHPRDHRLGRLRHGHADASASSELLGEPRFHFFEGDITINKEWIEYHVKKCDAVLPLVAIATPATYVKEPLRVFELDFEANLPIVRACVQLQEAPRVSRRPPRSTACRATASSTPRARTLVLRPDQQAALDLRLREAADGPRDPGLRHARRARLHAVPALQLDRRRARLARHGEGRRARASSPSSSATSCAASRSSWSTAAAQKRAFTYIDDGIAALMKIIANHGGIASRQDLQHRQPGATTSRCASSRR